MKKGGFDFNIFKAVFSGHRSFKEEFSSQVLAFLLSPHMRHGFGDTQLVTFLNMLGLDRLRNEIGHFPDDGKYCHSVFENLKSKQFSVAIEIEAKPAAKSLGRIDILLQIGNNLLIIENKILHSSVGDIERQMDGYVNDLQKHLPLECNLVPVVIFPAGYKHQYQGKHCDWSNLASALKGNLDKTQNMTAQSFLADFCDYVMADYASYASEGGTSKAEMQDFGEFLSQASGGSERHLEIIEKIFDAWRKCAYSGFNCDSQVYDGQIMYLPDRSGRMIYPFKISRIGSLILQHNAVKGNLEAIYRQLHAGLVAANIFGRDKSSCSIASLDEEKLDKLIAVFTETRRLIQGNNDNTMEQ